MSLNRADLLGDKQVMGFRGQACHSAQVQVEVQTGSSLGLRQRGICPKFFGVSGGSQLA